MWSPPDELPPFQTFTAMTGYTVLIFVGKILDFFQRIFSVGRSSKKGYAPLLSGFENFYLRRIYKHCADIFDRPVLSCPGGQIDILDLHNSSYGVPAKFPPPPESDSTSDSISDNTSNTSNTSTTIKHPAGEGIVRKCLNLGSYNYLGFADPDSPTVSEVLKSLETFSVQTCSSRTVLGTTSLHRQLERRLATFLDKPSAMIFGMGFATNSTGLPVFIRKGDLIVSDSLNHASIVTGARSSGGKTKVFKHNDYRDLERVIRQAIVDGQPRKRIPWKRIFIVVEGIYSMEGDICNLKEIVQVKKKYNCYLYVDEAHSIGALGKTGRGVCEHTGVDPADVDMLMGTFSKSFGAVGGYIAASRELINVMRKSCAGSVYSSSISPVCCQQIISALTIIMGDDGTSIGREKISTLRENATLFRKKLQSFGCIVLGDDASPVIPVLLGDVAKAPAFSRACLQCDMAVVSVGFPATQLYGTRVRFCMSAAHSKSDLLDALQKLEYVVSRTHIKYNKYMIG